MARKDKQKHFAQNVIKTFVTRAKFPGIWVNPARKRKKIFIKDGQ